MTSAPFRRVIWIVLDSVGIGEMPDAAAYGDAGSDTLGHIAAPAHAATCRNMAQLGLGNIKPLAARRSGRSPYSRIRPLRAGVARQGHHHGPLGDGRHPSRQAVSALPARISARDHAGVRTPHRARHAGQLRRFGHRDHQRARRGAHAHRQAHRLHFRRQRVSSGRARGSDPALGAIQDLRNRA